jgi:hypothetical protein
MKQVTGLIRHVRKLTDEGHFQPGTELSDTEVPSYGSSFLKTSGQTPHDYCHMRVKSRILLRDAAPFDN